MAKKKKRARRMPPEDKPQRKEFLEGYKSHARRYGPDAVADRQYAGRLRTRKDER